MQEGRTPIATGEILDDLRALRIELGQCFPIATEDDCVAATTELRRVIADALAAIPRDMTDVRKSIDELLRPY